jgi:hypothetical protein
VENHGTTNGLGRNGGLRKEKAAKLLGEEKIVG